MSRWRFVKDDESHLYLIPADAETLKRFKQFIIDGLDRDMAKYFARDLSRYTFSDPKLEEM